MLLAFFAGKKEGNFISGVENLSNYREEFQYVSSGSKLNTTHSLVSEFPIQGKAHQSIDNLIDEQ